MNLFDSNAVYRSEPNLIVQMSLSPARELAVTGYFQVLSIFPTGMARRNMFQKLFRPATFTPTAPWLAPYMFEVGEFGAVAVGARTMDELTQAGSIFTTELRLEGWEVVPAAYQQFELIRQANEVGAEVLTLEAMQLVVE